MSKKYSLIWIALWLVAHGLAAQEDKLKVVATASMLANMAEVIGGDLIEVQCIVPIGGDPHIYEATPRDARLINEANLILRNGLTFEGWLNELIENAGSQATVVTTTAGINPIESQQYANATDPHAWMDASLGLVYIENIYKALVKLDSTNQSAFRHNYEKYRTELIELDRYIKERIETIPEQQRILITSHDAFQYYGRRYGIRLESVLGTSTDADVQTSDILRLNKVIKESKVPALFIESTINPKILEQIAKDHRIKIGGKLYADSIGDQDSPASSYLKMLQYNTDVIVEALTTSSGTSHAEGGESGNNLILYGTLITAFLICLIILFRKLSP